MQKFLYAIGAVIALVIVIGLFLPRATRVEVSAVIDAPPAAVHALVNDFRRVVLWSPRIAADPNARVSHSGPQRGVGAAMSWDGVVIGSGTQVITESRPFEYVATTINPKEPGAASTWFEISRVGDETDVTWGFEHDHGVNIVGRYMALLLAGVIRRDHENGILALKELAESLPRADFGDLDIEHVDVEAQQIAYRPTTSTPGPAAISAAMGAAYFEILSFIDEHGLAEDGPPISIARGFVGADLRFDAAIPVRGVGDTTPREDNKVRLGTTYAGPAIRVEHVGSYRKLGMTHRKITAYLAALGIERAGDAWEVYVSDPTRVDESELRTYVYYPIRAH